MTCTQCGTEIPAGSNGCPACGFGSKVKLQLVGEAGTMTFPMNAEFGASQAGKVCGTDAKYMDETQFYVKVVDEVWFIKPHPRIRNKVYLNDAMITETTALHDGDRLSLKGKAAFMDVKYLQ